jgi:hypothetical protein
MTDDLADRVAHLEAIIFGPVDNITAELTTADVANRLGVTPRAVRNWIAKGACPARQRTRPSGTAGIWVVPASWVAQQLALNNPDNPTNQEQDPR